MELDERKSRHQDVPRSPVTATGGGPGVSGLQSSDLSFHPIS